MRKILSFLVILGIVAGLAYAGVVSDTPQYGLFKTGLSSTQKIGSYCVIGSATYRYVLNGTGTTENQYQPAWYVLDSGTDYTVSRYDSAGGSLEAFAGIWACDASGNTTIAKDGYGWIQTTGLTAAYVSIEGTSIAIGDVLIGSTDSSNSKTSVTAGQSYLTRGRAARTSLALSGATTLESGVPILPKAMEAYTTGNVSATKEVFLGN